MTDSQEQVLDEETWHLEAQAAINDIKKHVKAASVSTAIKNTNERIFINLTTLENATYCIEMSAAGFRIVGRQYDSTSNEDSVTYETPYALLNVISKKYKESFGGELMSKLLDLAKREG